MTNVTPQVNLLEVEHANQARKLAQLFARRLGVSEEEYIATIPPFPSRPSRQFMEDTFRPLIVEGRRISWKDQARLSEISVEDRLADLIISDWDKDPEGFNTPEQPFATWVSTGKAYDYRYVAEMRDVFTQGRVRGSSILEGIAYRNAYPKRVHLADGRLILPGSVVSKVTGDPMEQDAPYLDGWSSEFSVNLRLLPPDRLDTIFRIEGTDPFRPLYTVLVSNRDIRT